MTEKILYRVLCDEYEEVARIFFEVTETGEQIEGAHQIQKWVNSLFEENEQLKQDVEYWKQVASQYNNELNVFKHCKKYKTECKDIHWSSD